MRKILLSLFVISLARLPVAAGNLEHFRRGTIADLTFLSQVAGEETWVSIVASDFPQKLLPGNGTSGGRLIFYLWRYGWHPPYGAALWVYAEKELRPAEIQINPNLKRARLTTDVDFLDGYSGDLYTFKIEVTVKGIGPAENDDLGGWEAEAVGTVSAFLAGRQVGPENFTPDPSIWGRLRSFTSLWSGGNARDHFGTRTALAVFDTWHDGIETVFFMSASDFRHLAPSRGKPAPEPSLCFYAEGFDAYGNWVRRIGGCKQLAPGELQINPNLKWASLSTELEAKDESSGEVYTFRIDVSFTPTGLPVRGESDTTTMWSRAAEAAGTVSCFWAGEQSGPENLIPGPSYSARLMIETGVR